MNKSWDESTQKEKNLGFAGCAVVGIVLLVFIGIICGDDSDDIAELDKKSKSTESKIVEKPPLTEAEKRELRIRKQFHFWDGKHINLTEYIKRDMLNPDSFKHVKTTCVDNDSHLIVVMQYRGSNVFGAIVPKTVMAEVSLTGEIRDILLHEMGHLQ